MMPPMSVQGVGGPKTGKSSGGVDLLAQFQKLSQTDLSALRNEGMAYAKALAAKLDTPESRRLVAALDKALEPAKKGWGG
jgi:hypothetical protein